MSHNKLQFNVDKTQLLVCRKKGTGLLLNQLQINDRTINHASFVQTAQSQIIF